jgi:hypothetical protein
MILAPSASPAANLPLGADLERGRGHPRMIREADRDILGRLDPQGDAGLRDVSGPAEAALIQADANAAGRPFLLFQDRHGLLGARRQHRQKQPGKQGQAISHGDLPA